MHGLGLTLETLAMSYRDLAQRIVKLVRAEQPDGRGQLETLREVVG